MKEFKVTIGIFCLFKVDTLKDDINIIDVHEDDMKGDPRVWLTKAMTEEQVTAPPPIITPSPPNLPYPIIYQPPPPPPLNLL